MTMTPEEIVRDYKAAKTPSKQIGILAELNQCDREKIKQILVEAGCKLPGNCVGTKTKSKGVPLAGPEKPAKADDIPQEPEGGDGPPAKLPGAKSDEGKLDLTMVPPEIIRAVAEIRRYGNRKYADPQNWRSVPPEKIHKALIRHAVAMWEDPWAVDTESGMPHLWHLACNAAFLCAMMEGACDGTKE